MVVNGYDRMMKVFLKVVVLMMSLQLNAQILQMEVLIQGLPDKMVFLSHYENGGYHLIDSTMAVNGSFYFVKDPVMPDGMYRLDFQRPDPAKKEAGAPYIECIWSDESFTVYADYRDIAGTVSFDGSEENRVLGRFREYENLYERKMNVLYPLIDRYPEKDTFYAGASDHFMSLQAERDSLILGLSADHPGLFATRLIRAYRSPLIPADMQESDRVTFMKEHYFEKALLDDPALLYAPVYNRRIIDYLMLYRGRDYSFTEQEETFTEAVDIIMANVSGDPDLRSFVVEYLLDGFRSFGMEKIQTYIVDTYADETCTTDAVALAEQRVEGYRKMAEGQVAEDIMVRDADRQLQRLSEVDADYTLVLFWATYCEHCMEMMPELQAWYREERPGNLEVFTVSIDTVVADWQRFSEVFDPSWINTHEPMGWEGKSAEDYNIYATPTMFLLDRERRIIARPFTLRELRREIRRL